MNIDILNYYYREAKVQGFIEFDDDLMNQVVLQLRKKNSEK